MKRPPTVQYIHVEPPPSIVAPVMFFTGLVIVAIVWFFIP